MATQLSLALLTLYTVFALHAWSGTAGNVLYSGGKLLSGERLAYRQYSLVMQKDCNLVVYDGNEPIWASGTSGKGNNCFLTLESNGELIINGYQLIIPYSFTVWRSGATSVEGRYVLVLEHDGGLRVYGPAIWFAPTKSVELSGDGYKEPAVIDSVLWTGDVAPIGDTIVNTVYKLALESNCNLTLSDTSTQKVLWYTNTSNNLHDCFVNLETNGELKVKYMGGETLWSSGVSSQYGLHVVVLSDTADLVVYGPAIWTAEKFGVVAVAVSPDDSVLTGEKIAMVTKE